MLHFDYSLINPNQQKKLNIYSEPTLDPSEVHMLVFWRYTSLLLMERLGEFTFSGHLLQKCNRALGRMMKKLIKYPLLPPSPLILTIEPCESIQRQEKIYIKPMILRPQWVAPTNH